MENIKHYGYVPPRNFRTKKKSKKVIKRYAPPMKYKSFNVFTDDGRNIVVKSDVPLTLEEAQFKYHALAISGN